MEESASGGCASLSRRGVGRTGRVQGMSSSPSSSLMEYATPGNRSSGEMSRRLSMISHTPRGRPAPAPPGAPLRGFEVAAT